MSKQVELSEHLSGKVLHPYWQDEHFKDGFGCTLNQEVITPSTMVRLISGDLRKELFEVLDRFGFMSADLKGKRGMRRALKQLKWKQTIVSGHGWHKDYPRPGRSEADDSVIVLWWSHMRSRIFGTGFTTNASYDKTLLDLNNGKQQFISEDWDENMTHCLNRKHQSHVCDYDGNHLVAFQDRHVYHTLMGSLPPDYMTSFPLFWKRLKRWKRWAKS